MDKRFLVHEAVNDDLITIFAIFIPFISNRGPISERSILPSTQAFRAHYISIEYKIKTVKVASCFATNRSSDNTVFFYAFETILYTQNNNADHISMFTVIPTAHHYNHYI